jgi:hypothetical protein
LIVNITTITPISSAAGIGMPHLFGKVSCGQLKLPKWGFGGILGMEEGLGFGRISGLGTVAWPHSSRRFVQSLMSMG